nr:replication associated protein [Flumine microvirus 32]
MPCYYPITAYRAKAGRSETGGWPLVFDTKNGLHDLPIQIPCGRCIGCRLERSRQWAIRCIHEASLHDQNCFITLTYNSEYVNENLSLEKKDFVLFMKKLRNKYGEKIKFFHCGEYGDNFSRPHHHACLFNMDFTDKKLIREYDQIKTYTSESLQQLWGKGFCTVGDVTFESAAYVARYTLKKVTGKKAEEHYNGREPEYVSMSRRPGIGHDWIEKYKNDVYPSDKVIERNMQCKPPRYYDKRYDAGVCAFKQITLRSKRQNEAKDNPDNNHDRRMVKEIITRERMKIFSRNLSIQGE